MAENGKTELRLVTTLQPNEKQLLFLQDHHKHVAYGGARGGGKSWVARVKAVLLCRRWPGIKVMIIRRTLAELRNNHIDPLRLMLKGIATYHQVDKRFVFANGSTLFFSYCDNDNDVLQYQGAEYDVIFLEEATQLKEEWIQKIITCCRGTNGYPKRVYYTTNPGGPSHQYFKRLFIDKRYKDEEDPEEYSFIQALVTDNHVLMETQPDYVKFLKSLPPKLRDAWLNGRWDIFEGQFFEDFRIEPDVMAAHEAGCDLDARELLAQRRWVHVIEPFRIRDYWPIYRSFDWGYHRPFSCGWWTVDDDGVIYRVAELYGVQHMGQEAIANEGVKWPPDKVFGEIQKVEHTNPMLKGKRIQGIADPAIWKAESGVSFAETAGKYGIYFQAGDNAREAGWMQCHYRLMFDHNGYPMMYVFNTCKDFIRTIPSLEYDEHRAEDLDSDGEDHAADEWRYFCMSRPIKPTVTEEPYAPMYGADPLDTVKPRGGKKNGRIQKTRR